MCVLCYPENLRLLTSPAAGLPELQLAEAIRVAREAATQYVLDTVHAMREDPTPPSLHVSPEEYVHYVVERAREDGVATRGELRAWTAPGVEYATDPRVQAFVSSAVEGLAGSLARIREQREVIARFLEIRPEGLHFAGVGLSAEMYFRHGEDTYVALTDEEAAQIAMDRISWNLSHEDPRVLLHYTDLPDGAVDILADAQQRPEDEANQVLAGMVDVPALADDTLRQRGYGWLVTDTLTDVLAEQRFGDRVILRCRFSEDPFGEE